MPNEPGKGLDVVAVGLGWPEGPTVLPDGRVVLVESYRSRLTAVGAGWRSPAFRRCDRRAELLRARRGRGALCVPERRHDGTLARRRDDRAVDPARA